MEPDLDKWTSLFLIAACTGIFVCILLLAKAVHNRILVYPALIIGAFSMVLIQYVLFWSNYQFVFPYLRFTPNVFLHLIAVWILSYGYSLSGSTVPISRKVLYLPAAFGLILNLSYWTGLLDFSAPNFSLAEKILFISVNPWIVVGVYLTVIFLLLKRSRHLPSGKGGHLKFMAAFAGLFTVAYGSYFILVRFAFFNAEWDYAISVVMSIGIYTVGGWLALRPADLEFVPEEEEKNELLESESAEAVFEEVKRLVEKEKRYRHEGLRLEGLAAEMELPRNYLSYAINKQSGRNFNRFVNDIRLAEAEHLLISRPDMPVKSIYYQVGFSNKASFYAAFKEKQGCTPSQFRQRGVHAVPKVK